MGEAEDAVLAREAREREAQRAATDRRIRELREQIEGYVPQALNRLRELGWPDGPYPIQRKTLRIEGEERVGWVIYSGWGYEHMLYLLGDGSFARYSCGSPYIAEPGNTPYGMEEVEKGLEGIRMLAEGPPPEPIPVTPPRVRRTVTPPPPPRPWWKRLLGL